MHHRNFILTLYFQLCVQAMAERDMIAGLIRVVNHCIGEELGLVGETLFCIFDTPYSDPLIAQVSCVVEIDFYC